MINGSNIPDADNRGRAFPYKETGPHFVGPCIVNGVLMVIKAWRNTTADGREYYRYVFDKPEDCPGL